MVLQPVDPGLIPERLKFETTTGTVELQARLEAASPAGDRDAEHAIWREREERQATCQAKVDNASRRLDSAMIRLEAYESPASTLGFSYS